MSKTKELVNEEAKKLADNLGKIQKNIEQIINLKKYREQTGGIEQTELDRLTDLCESYLDDINILFKSVNYLSQERIEGKLYLASNGKFWVEGVDIELKEGYSLEIFFENVNKGEHSWQIGRVMCDNTSETYYFVGEGSKRYQLKQGILAAIRPEAICASAKSGCNHHVH